MNASIRMARADDLDNLARLLDEVVLLHHDEDPTQFLAPEAAAHHRFLVERFQDPNAAIFVADENGAPAGGSVTFNRGWPPFPNPNKFGLLENLSVTTKFRRT